MILKLGIGIDEIKFGMTQSEIENVLGPADRKRINFKDENKIVLDYNNYKVRVVFYPYENDKLGYIETSNPELTYNNQRILDSEIEFAEQVIFGNEIMEWEIEEYHSFTSYFNEKYWLTLHVKFGRINYIELGVPFKDVENYNWPG